MRLYQQLDDIQGLLMILVAGSKTVLNMEEAARYLNVSKSYLYKLTSTNKIPHYSPGRKLIYFKKEELELWITQ